MSFRVGWDVLDMLKYIRMALLAHSHVLVVVIKCPHAYLHLAIRLLFPHRAGLLTILQYDHLDPRAPHLENVVNRRLAPSMKIGQMYNHPSYIT